MLLALGPNIKENYVSTTAHELADAAVTAAYILDVDPEYATGELVSEILKSHPNSNTEIENTSYPQIKVRGQIIDLVLEKPDFVTMEIFDLMGKKLEVTINNEFLNKVSSFSFIQKIPQGVYYKDAI